MIMNQINFRCIDLDIWEIFCKKCSEIVISDKSYLPLFCFLYNV